ncbi:MAG: putative Ig domain-containing protein [Terriglobia bacterium]
MKRLVLAICGLAVIGGCGGGAGEVAISPPTPPAISLSPSAQNIDQGQTVRFTATIENDASGKGVTWSCSGAVLMGTACGTFTSTTLSTATYNAPPAVSGNLSITVMATDVDDPAAYGSATVVVYPPPSITTATLPLATPNANYNAALQATGGVGALTWSLAGGALPTGLSLSSSGTISGDPTVSGTSTFTVQATDSSAAPGGPGSARATLSLTVVMALSITTASLPAGSEGATYLAEIDASGGTAPYTWSVAAGSLPPGLVMVPSSAVIAGTPTAQGNFTFTAVVTDSSPTPQTQSQSFVIALGAPGPLAITTSALLDGTLGTPYNAKMAATGGTPPYTWSVFSGALPPNVSLNASTGAIAGTPSSAGTASFAIMATDSSSPPQTQTQALSIAIVNAAAECPSAGNNVVLSGSYAFSLSGFNDAGFLTVVGSFTADGAGNITAGEADTNGILGAQQGDIITSASSYSVGPDNRGCATLATPFGTFATRFALGSTSAKIAASGRMIEWDSPSASAYIATGQLLLQTSSVFAGGLSGSYVFRTVGWDPAALGGRDACVGVLGAGSNTFNGFEQDCNDAWNLTTVAAPDVAGSYTPLDANGRGTGVLAVGESNVNITVYAVSASQLLVLNADFGPFSSGEMNQQSVPAGGAGFTQASLDGNMVFYLNGLSLEGTASTVSMETASADGSSVMTINFYMDRAGTMQVAGTLACTYAVEPSGRVTLSSSTQSCGSDTPVFYLAGLNTGFLVDTAPGVDTGALEPQSAGPFSNASLAGDFSGGMAEVVLQSPQAEVDSVSPDGNGDFTGTTDFTSTSTQDVGAPLLAATYTVNPDGTFVVSSSNGAVAGIVISDSQFVMLSPSTLATSYPTLLVVQK